ncbi:DUF4360 domain-containing protein [Streptomyces sp. LARHCF249]
MFRTVFIGGTAVALLASAFAPSGGAQNALKPTEPVTIKLATVNGSGCRPGTATVAVAPDNTAFTVTYSEYLAKAGKGTQLTDQRKNCQLALDVHIPQGYTYGIATADYRGYANLAKGAFGTQVANYYFQGMSKTAHRKHRINGPKDDNWQVTDRAPVGSVVHKACGDRRNFNINTELRVDAGQANPATTSYIAMDSTDTSITTTYHFSWKKCHK